MNPSERKIVPSEELRRIREELRREGRVVVQCHGCFDIVHPGHIRYLRFAKEQGDCLIVSVSADDFVGKGHDRPYIGETLRAENLAALEFVDWVCIDRNDWAGPVLEALRPDIYVKGKEYERSTDPRFAREKELVESFGGAVIFSSGEVVYSSTAIIDRFRDRLALDRDRIRSFCQRHQLSRQGLEALVGRFTGLKVLVVGDAILDHYVHCDVASVAAESPVLNATEIGEEWFVGAAGLIAAQCAALGAEATLLTAVADDSTTADFARRLEATGVRFELVEEKQRPVYVKRRYLADGSKIFKVNRGPYAPLTSVGSKAMRGRLTSLAQEQKAVLVTDFGYGLFPSDVVDEVSALPERGVPYFLDVSQSSAASLLRFRRPACTTPTEAELRLAFADHESGLSNLANRFYRATEAKRLVITMGKRGAVVFQPPPPDGGRLDNDFLPSFVTFPVDAVGAGDVFLAATALSELAGGGAAGLFLAMSVAALHVERLGNEPVDLPELLQYLRGSRELA